MQDALRWLTTIALVPACISGAGTPVLAQRDSSAGDALVRNLIEQWTSQSQSIATAHIRYRSYAGRVGRTDLTPEVVEELLLGVDLVRDPDTFADLLAEFHKGTDRADRETPWFDREYEQIGDLRRDTYHSGHLEGQVRILNAEHDYLYEPGSSHHQVTLHHQGASSLMPPGMHLFLKDPSRGLPADRFRVVSRGEAIKLEFLPTSPVEPFDWMEVDPATGLMTREVAFHKGLLYQDHRQLGLTEYSGGIVLPAVSLTLDYRDGFLKTVYYRGILSAELNGPIDEERFEMPVPDGAVVVDQRATEPSAVRSTAAEDDVVSFLAAVSPTPTGAPATRSSLWRWLLAVNGIALILLSVILWRRSRSAPKMAEPKI